MFGLCHECPHMWIREICERWNGSNVFLSTIQILLTCFFLSLSCGIFCSILQLEEQYLCFSSKCVSGSICSSEHSENLLVCTEAYWIVCDLVWWPGCCKGFKVHKPRFKCFDVKASKRATLFHHLCPILFTKRDILLIICSLWYEYS